MISCGDSKKTNEKTMDDSIAERPLSDELNARKLNFEKKATEDKKRIYAEGQKAIENNQIVQNALQVGDVAVNFTLKNATGKSVTLYDELEKGPVILMWYRGGWCPYCNITLHHMQNALPEFKKQGANLIALSPEIPDSSITTKEKNELQFELLSDVGNIVARQYKVVYKLTDDVANSYENSFGLSKYNGNNSAELPLAVTYIIDQNKVIRYAFLDADYKKRAEPQEIIEFLNGMK